MADLVTILTGDALTILRTLESESVHCCVTSPPYWGLRDYGVDGQMGLEKTPDEYVAGMVAVFAEVRRVLREDGTLWLNLGDSYARTAGDDSKKETDGGIKTGRSGKSDLLFKTGNNRPPPWLKPKDLIGIPWMVAFALRADGWYLRSDIIWAKPNPMPESVTDRPTRSHEYIFLLSKSSRYFYDADAIKEPCSESFANDSRWQTGSTDKNNKNGYSESKAQNPKSVHRIFDKQLNGNRTYEGFNGRWDQSEANGTVPLIRNKRDVWSISPAQFPEAHFATFPPDLIKPCILAGCPVGGTVLDPFAGSGTTGQVAMDFGRKAVMIELNPEYVKLIQQRCARTPGLPL